jgi:hypothetical protein
VVFVSQPSEYPFKQSPQPGEHEVTVQLPPEHVVAVAWAVSGQSAAVQQLMVGMQAFEHAL